LAGTWRHLVFRWGLGEVDVDPGKRCSSWWRNPRRAQRYAEELEQRVAEHGLHDALVGASLVVDANGKTHQVGEYVRGLTQLEAAERDRCASMCTKAITAGLCERQVRLAERQMVLLAEVLRAVSTDPELALSDAQRAALPGVIRTHLGLE
jgi:hypothetical protein